MRSLLPLSRNGLVQRESDNPLTLAGQPQLPGALAIPDFGVFSQEAVLHSNTGGLLLDTG